VLDTRAPAGNHAAVTALPILLLLLLTPALLAAYAALHEWGRYLAGRLLVRISPSQLRLVLDRLPARLELRTAAGDWVAPADWPRYQDAYARHDRHGRHALGFLTAGYLLQPAAALLAAAAARAAGRPGVALWLIVGSILVNVLLIGADLAVSVRVRAPAGDLSAALTLAPGRTGLLVTLLVLAHGAWLL
jgi:hypothetical protein